MDNRGSKSAILNDIGVKEQRVDDSSVFLTVRCTLALWEIKGSK